MAKLKVKRERTFPTDGINYEGVIREGLVSLTPKQLSHIYASLRNPSLEQGDTWQDRNSFDHRERRYDGPPYFSRHCVGKIDGRTYLATVEEIVDREVSPNLDDRVRVPEWLLNRAESRIKSGRVSIVGWYDLGEDKFGGTFSFPMYGRRSSGSPDFGFSLEEDIATLRGKEPLKGFTTADGNFKVLKLGSIQEPGRLLPAPHYFRSGVLVESPDGVEFPMYENPSKLVKAGYFVGL